MKNKTPHSAEMHLIVASKRYPELNKWVNMFRADMGKDLPSWPQWCFLPMAAWYSMVSANYGVNKLSIDQAGDVAKIAAVGTWKYSQGIYRIDPLLLQALIDSPVSGELPSDLFYRLPEWCIYIDLSHMSDLSLPWAKAGEVRGFWVHLEYDVNDGRTELRFLFDCKSDLISIPLHIGDWSVLEAAERATAEINKHSTIMKLTSHDAEDVAKTIGPMLSIVLYLCSEEPEIDSDRVPVSGQYHARPKKTKKGMVFFPPDKPTFFDVGREIGEKLRQASYGSEPTGRTVRPHLRRAHWHGFWKGPRDGERKYVCRWLPPIMVNVDDE